MSTINLDGVEHHPAISEIVDVLCAKTQNTDRGFFQVEVAYYLCLMAATMRATIVTKDRGEIPVSSYVLALATSGYGKGHSISIMENEFLRVFRKRFMEDTFHIISDQMLSDIANERAARNGADQQEERDRAEKEFRALGAYPFTFDSGTPPAVKQLRHKLLMSGCGAINLQIDEIGSNLVGATDVLTLFLELFDQGVVKQKLVKNTADNTRNEEIEGKTPTNMLLFGTPAKLFDGHQTEDQFYEMLQIGYARRCIFGLGQDHRRTKETRTPAEIYQALINPANNGAVNKWAAHFHKLADPAMFGWKMQVEDEVAIKLLEYKLACEQVAEAMPEHDEVRKAEMSHRYFKALKLAGAFAFIDESSEVEMEHLLSAIRLVEESGECFQAILKRDAAYMKLARYLGEVEIEKTHADLMEALPFYKAGQAPRNELMNLATAWGYKNHIIIKKNFIDGIEFFKGERLKETDLDQLIISYSDHWAYNYEADLAPFDQLHMLTQLPGHHFANHHFNNSHRSEENAIPGFNLVVLDIDEGTSIEAVKELMSDHKFLLYTTKRHQTEGHGDRFRMLLPLNYTLKLDSEEYIEFMNGLFGWLPFKTDESYRKREKKSETYHAGEFFYNMDGGLLDGLKFIPKTKRNEEYRQQSQQLGSLDNLERWFAQRMEPGNRNNQMIKFALALADSGMKLSEVIKAVHAFNVKIGTPLPAEEIESTILVTVSKRYQRN